VELTRFGHSYAVNFSFLLNGQTYQVNLRSLKKLPAELTMAAVQTADAAKKTC